MRPVEKMRSVREGLTPLVATSDSAVLGSSPELCLPNTANSVLRTNEKEAGVAWLCWPALWVVGLVHM